MSKGLIRPAPLGRRLAAVIYDSLLVIALWFLAGFAALPFTGGQAVSQGHPVFMLLLYGILAAFFIWFWTRGGQTLGMRAWRLQIRRADTGQGISLTQAGLRLLLAVPSWGFFGLGVLAMLVDPQRRTLHDRLSGTEIILLPPPAPPHKNL